MYLMGMFAGMCRCHLHMTYANKETLTVSQRKKKSLSETKPIKAQLLSACDVQYSVYSAGCFYDVINVTSGI